MARSAAAGAATLTSLAWEGGEHAFDSLIMDAMRR